MLVRLIFNPFSSIRTSLPVNWSLTVISQVASVTSLLPPPPEPPEPPPPCLASQETLCCNLSMASWCFSRTPSTESIVSPSWSSLGLVTAIPVAFPEAKTSHLPFEFCFFILLISQSYCVRFYISYIICSNIFI